MILGGAEFESCAVFPIHGQDCSVQPSALRCVNEYLAIDDSGGYLYTREWSSGNNNNSSLIKFLRYVD